MTKHKDKANVFEKFMASYAGPWAWLIKGNLFIQSNLFFIPNGIKLKFLIHRKTEVFTHDLHTTSHYFRWECFKFLPTYSLLELFPIDCYHYLSFTHKHWYIYTSYSFFRKIRAFFPFKLQLLFIQYPCVTIKGIGMSFLFFLHPFLFLPSSCPF